MSGMQNQRHLYSGKYTAPQSGDRARPPNDLSNTHPPDLGLTAVPQQQGTVDVNPTGNSRQLPVTGLYRHRLISPGQQRVHLVQVGGGDPSVPAIGSRNGFQVGRNGIEHVTRGDGRVPFGYRRVGHSLWNGIWSKVHPNSGNDRLLMRAVCLLYTSPSPRDRTRYRMPSSA